MRVRITDSTCEIFLIFIPYQVHLFGEGKVNQPDTYPTNGESARLPRFKWGTCVLENTKVEDLLLIVRLERE